MAHYIHHVPGRLRVKIASLKRNPQAAREVEQLLASHTGVVRCETNTVTGSVIVGYDPRITSAEFILTHLRAHAVVTTEAPIPVSDPVAAGNDSQLVRTLTSVGETAGKALFGFVVEKAMERSAAALIGALL